ncbi:MAG: FlgO family outer membrane protein [Deltaproteobacteria bacterium]|nr:FlgO family outer membrane protein [Deltaproteobacteria bacterium]
MQLTRKRCSSRPTPSFLPKIVVILALLVFPGQATAFSPFTQDKPPEIKVNEADALRTEIQGLANELFRNLADADPENGDLGKGVLICTFVELKKLSRTSSLGRYVAEQLMNEMQQHHYEVVEIRKSQAIMLQEKRGEFGLSRNPAEVSQAATAGAMLTGTYTSSKDSIVINARIIDNRSAKLLSSATAIIPRNQLAEQLLADTASVRMEKPEPLYLKKLEL